MLKEIDEGAGYVMGAGGSPAGKTGGLQQWPRRPRNRLFEDCFQHLRECKWKNLPAHSVHSKPAGEKRRYQDHASQQDLGWRHLGLRLPFWLDTQMTLFSKWKIFCAGEFWVKKVDGGEGRQSAFIHKVGRLRLLAVAVYQEGQPTALHGQTSVLGRQTNNR